MLDNNYMALRNELKYSAGLPTVPLQAVYLKHLGRSACQSLLQRWLLLSSVAVHKALKLEFALLHLLIISEITALLGTEV